MPTSSVPNDVPHTTSGDVPTIKLTDALRRQRYIVVMCTILGIALAWLYVDHATVRFESKARVLVNQHDQALVHPVSTANRDDNLISEDVLANHMQMLQSRRNVEDALSRDGLIDLASIVEELDDDQDTVDYVIDNLRLTRGGKGDARAARSIEITFRHTDANDTRRILDSVVDEYMRMIDQQFSDSLAVANDVILKAQREIESELQDAQQEFIQSRKTAPVLFTGDGSSNVYVSQYETLADQMVAIEIRESTIAERLAKASKVADEYSDVERTLPIEALGVIDTESLQRLGVFASMKANSTRSAEFQRDQPERLEEARTQYTHLLRLMSEKQRLAADFGPSHPEVKKLQEEIALVEEFLDEHQIEYDSEMDEPQLTSRQLLDAYIGFLKNEVASLKEQKKALGIRLEESEKRARSLVEFELRHEVLRSKIDRNQQLFEGLAEQLGKVNMTNGIDGYIHEILEQPRTGIQIWPERSVCCAGGLLVGLVAGLFLALVNDQLNPRFVAANEIHHTSQLPVLGYVGKLPTGRRLTNGAQSQEDTEPLRMVRTMLLNDVRNGTLSTLAATSTSSGDGKSTILSNLAMSFASVGIPVVIVDADMRRPTMGRQFCPKQSVGLSELLNGNCPLEDAVCPTDIPNLSVLPAGSSTATPAELLESETFTALIKELRSQYALTIVDVGPVLAVSDALVVSRIVDGTILIVRPSRDTRRDVADAADMLRATGANLLGTIVNTVGSSKHFQRGSYGYTSSDRTAGAPQEVV